MPPPPPQPYGPQPAFYTPQYAQVGSRSFIRGRPNIASVVLIAAGAIAIGVSIFLEWFSAGLFGRSYDADQIPLEFLWDNTPTSLNAFPLRWPIMLGAIVMFGSAFNSRAKAGAFVGGIVALACSVLFLNAVRRVHADATLDVGGSALAGVGIGPWVCGIGALVGVFGAIVSLRPPTSP